jgi:DNA polymerase III delta prime subunit
MLQLFGRAEAAERVRQAMAVRGRPNPVLVFEGPPGSGKTSLLAALAESLHNRVPSASVDVGSARLDSERGELGAIPSLVAELAFQLARQAGGYGALAFPRLVIGFLVQRLDLDRLDRDRARRQVDEALRAHRGVDRWTSTLQEAAGQLVAQVPGGPGVPPSLLREIFAGTVGLAGRWGPGRRLLLGPYQQWYGHQDLGLTDPAIEALVGLKRSADSAAHDPDHQRRIDDLLLRAFLADLRDAFRRAERSGGWSFNAVLLLDNVDGELGEAFLTELVRIRRDVLAGGTAGQDPLTVVVTSRGGLLAAVDDGAVPDLVERPDRRDAAAREQFWQRVPLTPLTLTEISAMIAQLALSNGNTQHLATVVHEFTRGQVAATELLLKAIDRKGRADVELADLLRSPREGRSLEQQLLDRLLQGVETGSREDLEVCAAARTAEPVKRLTRTLGLARGRGGPATAPLWTTEDEVTLVRRLLLRRLATTHRWDDAFETLRADAAEQQDADLELYYAVGLGRWGEIAAALTERLEPGSVPDWLDDLHRIAAAPARPAPGTEPGQPEPARPARTRPERTRREPAAAGATRRGPDRSPSGPKPPAAAPAALADGLARRWIDDASPPRFVTVVKLLTALSVARDPLCGADRGDLYRRISDHYRELSEYPNLGCHELDVLERRYLRLSRDWHRVPPPAGTAAD